MLTGFFPKVISSRHTVGLASLVLLGSSCVVQADDGQKERNARNDKNDSSVAPAAAAGSGAVSSSGAVSPQTKTLGAIHVTGRLTGGTQPPAAYAGGQVATGGRVGVLGEQDSFNSPFSVISYTSQLIENEQADTVGSVLQNDAGVQMAYGSGTAGEIFQIRGFPLYGQDISFGGLYGVLPRQVVQTNFVNRVELFKGSNAFANGVSPGGSGVGGAVNLEPKWATDAPITNLKLGYESDSQIDEEVDLGRRYGTDKQFGVRLDAQHAKGDTAINGENAADTSVGLGLDYRGKRARASLYFGYQHQHLKHFRSVIYTSAATEVPEPPDAETNYAPPYAATQLKTEFGLLRGSFDLTENWTAYAAVGANHSREDSDYAGLLLSDDNGNAGAYRISIPYEANLFTGQAGFRGQFETGPVSHQINFGYSGYYRRMNTAYRESSLTDLQATNIYRPADLANPETTISGGDFDDPPIRNRHRADGWAISDTAGLFDDRLLITVGARYQSLRIENFSAEGVFDGSPVVNHAVSPVYGAVFKPLDWLSLYANHIEALQAGDAAPTQSANFGKVIGIADSKQNEVGAKVDFGDLGGGLALYQIEKPSAYTDPATNVYGYYGKQRNRGLELSVFGKPTERLRLMASASWIDPELTDTANGANDGNDAVGVTDYRLVFQGDWQLPRAPRWSANARVIRSGSQYADAANTLKLKPWTRVDLGLRYKMPFGNQDQDITWRANITNVADSDYWASAQSGYLTQGDPRTFKLSATVHF